MYKLPYFNTQLHGCICRRLAEMRKREDYEETETDAVRVTALEDEDKWHQELKTVAPASRVTGKFVKLILHH